MSSTGSSTKPLEISVKATHQMLVEGAEFCFVDCRTPGESATASIASATLIPMETLADRLGDLPEDKGHHIVVHCHHGGRSLRVTHWLRQQGYLNCQSMAGGIDAWSDQIDPTVPKY
ncbi:MAG: rhodanese-like domain-containing protein [Pirellulaceae bacterium]